MMDSGNSGSMQSSSGGEEDYDSRAESISNFTGRPISNPPPLFHHQNQQQQELQPHSTSSTMFDSLSNFFDPASLSSRLLVTNNPLLSLDMVWAQSNQRPDDEPINPTDLSALIPSSSTQTRAQLPFLPAPLESQGRAPPSPPPPQLLNENNNNNSNNGNDVGPGSGPGPIRNPRKRSRASRRAPTTVLTTDTTNFRAMVQEFTGIPAPPFSSSTPALFPGSARTRLELFSSRSDGHNLLDPSPPPPYLLRPFPQKVPFLSPPPSTSTSSVGPDVNNSTFLNMQNSILNLQPALLNVQPPSNGTRIQPAPEYGPSGGVWAGPAWNAARWE